MGKLQVARRCVEWSAKDCICNNGIIYIILSTAGLNTHTAPGVKIQRKIYSESLSSENVSVFQGKRLNQCPYKSRFRIHVTENRKLLVCGVVDDVLSNKIKKWHGFAKF